MTLCASVSVVSALLFASLPAALADAIPYGNPGTPAAAVTVTATSTGSLIGYFVNSSAGYVSEIAMLNLTTGIESPFYFSTQSTAPGTMVDFGSITAGDHIVFILHVDYTGDLFRSDAVNTDGIPHAYLTPFSGGAIDGTPFPAGTYVGFEDLPLAASDLDYDDDNFIFTNVSAAPSAVPEPGTLSLIGTGVLAGAAAVRRRLSL